MIRRQTVFDPETYRDLLALWQKDYPEAEVANQHPIIARPLPSNASQSRHNTTQTAALASNGMLSKKQPTSAPAYKNANDSRPSRNDPWQLAKITATSQAMHNFTTPAHSHARNAGIKNLPQPKLSTASTAFRSTSQPAAPSMTGTKAPPAAAKGIRDYYGPRAKVSSDKPANNQRQPPPVTSLQDNDEQVEEAIIEDALITDEAAAQFSQTTYEGLQQETAENGAWGTSTE